MKPLGKFALKNRVGGHQAALDQVSKAAVDGEPHGAEGEKHHDRGD